MKHIAFWLLVALFASCSLGLGCKEDDTSDDVGSTDAGADPDTGNNGDDTASEADTVNPNAPVITDYELREEWTDGNLVIWQDIYFEDADGDVDTVDYELVDSSADDLIVDDGTIDLDADTQMAGAMISGQWDCGGGVYTATLEVSLVDQAGNRSNIIEYTLNCVDTP